MTEYADKELMLRMARDTMTKDDARVIERFLKSVTPADVVERSRVDKAIDEITQYGAVEKETGNKEVANAILDVLEILKRNLGGEQMVCNNLCKRSEEHCSHCQQNYDVSSKFYSAKRNINSNYVTGYLVRDKKDGSILGILNKANKYAELAWIDESTLTEVET